MKLTTSEQAVLKVVRAHNGFATWEEISEEAMNIPREAGVYKPYRVVSSLRRKLDSIHIFAGGGVMELSGEKLERARKMWSGWDKAWVTLTCPVCGETFPRREGDITSAKKRNKETGFCSRSCSKRAQDQRRRG